MGGGLPEISVISAMVIALLGSAATGTFIVFVIMRLAGAIQEWSWWWITSPLWVVLASTVALVVMMAIFMKKLNEWIGE